MQTAAGYGYVNVDRESPTVVDKSMYVKNRLKVKVTFSLN